GNTTRHVFHTVDRPKYHGLPFHVEHCDDVSHATLLVGSPQANGYADQVARTMKRLAVPSGSWITMYRPASVPRGVGGPDRTTIPPGRTNLIPNLMVLSELLAHRATAASKELRKSPGTSRTRLGNTAISANRNSRTAVLRNDARRSLDSTRSIRMSGLTIFKGIPGTPAPDPISTKLVAVWGTTWRNRRLSTNRFSTIHSGALEPIILC